MTSFLPFRAFLRSPPNRLPSHSCLQYSHNEIWAKTKGVVKFKERFSPKIHLTRLGGRSKGSVTRGRISAGRGMGIRGIGCV